LPKPSEWTGRAASLYLLQFNDRCKVGISSNPPDRLKAINTTHRQTRGEGVLMAAISEPTAHAYRVEQSLLRQFGVLRLAGEYLAIDFETLAGAATVELTRARKLPTPASSRISSPPELRLNADSVPVRQLAPKVMQIDAGPHRFAVEWNLHESALHISQWQTLRKYFPARAEAMRFWVEMWRVWLATLAATGIERDRVLGIA
jgi:hypothetical protein